MIGNEHLAAQGIPVFAERTCGRRFICPYADRLDPMTENFERHLAGIAICVPIIGLLMSYVMSTIERRTEVTLSPP
eukprot:11348106-Alexandrium_andersonii.AAC.1